MTTTNSQDLIEAFEQARYILNTMSGDVEVNTVVLNVPEKDIQFYKDTPNFLLADQREARIRVLESERTDMMRHIAALEATLYDHKRINENKYDLMEQIRRLRKQQATTDRKLQQLQADKEGAELGFTYIARRVVDELSLFSYTAGPRVGFQMLKSWLEARALPDVDGHSRFLQLMERAVTAERQLSETKAELETKLEKVQKELADAKAEVLAKTDQLTRLADNADAWQKKAVELDAALKEASRGLDTVQRQGSGYYYNSAYVQSLEQRLKTVIVERESLYTRLAEAKEAHQQAEDELQQEKPPHCPTCHQPMTRDGDSGDVWRCPHANWELFAQPSHRSDTSEVSGLREELRKALAETDRIRHELDLLKLEPNIARAEIRRLNDLLKLSREQAAQDVQKLTRELEDARAIKPDLAEARRSLRLADQAWTRALAKLTPTEERDAK